MLAAIGDWGAQAVLSGSLLLAVVVAVLAGLVSFASPCVLPLLPGYLALLGGMAPGVAGGTAAVTAVAGGGSADLASADLASADEAPAGRGSPSTASATSAGAAAGVGAAAAIAHGPGLPATAQDGAAPPRARLLAGTALFVAGFSAVFVAYGVLAGSLGSALLAWSDPLGRVLGVVVVAMGLAFLGWLPLLRGEARVRIAPRAGLWGAPLLGVTFGLGWTPCIGPTLAAILLLSLDGGSPARGAVLALAFCLGLGLPFLLVASGVSRAGRVTDWLRRHRLAVMRAGGGLLVVIGLAMVTGVWQAWAAWLQGLLTGTDPFVPAL